MRLVGLQSLPRAVQRALFVIAFALGVAMVLALAGCGTPAAASTPKAELPVCQQPNLEVMVFPDGSRIYLLDLENLKIADQVMKDIYAGRCRPLHP